MDSEVVDCGECDPSFDCSKGCIRTPRAEPTVVQVGGTHYQASYQHWHWVEDTGLGYLESNATKYLTRWKRKDGLKDLKKAQSYVAQLIFIQENGRYNRVTNPDYVLFKRFCESNEVVGTERDACLLLFKWNSPEDLMMAQQIIMDLIYTHFPDQNQARVGGDIWSHT